MSRQTTLIRAIKEAKASEFGLTGIKVELEAQLNRHNDGCYSCDGSRRARCEHCEEDGYVRCDGNEGECEEGWVNCRNNCEDGQMECTRCGGNGRTTDSIGRERVCRACDGDGELECSACEGSGDQRCEYNCDEGWLDCGECENGYVDCDECYQDTDARWGDEDYCQQWILEKLATHGLSEQEHGVWQVKGPLVFAMFYNDHSVDSELTFTVSMDDPENVKFIPIVTQVFKDLADEMGAEMDIDGAGMHMALLKTEDCDYTNSSGSYASSGLEIKQYNNFKKSMGLLMPALFFLGSNGENSRPLEYRRPGVGSAMYDDNHGKYSAINWNNGALEFRVFETCYDKPEATLDNIVVMCNSLKYWTAEYTRNYLSNVTKKVKFGRNGRGLERFYVLKEHVDLLNRGLKLLKPDYLTVTELKKQRKFKVSKGYLDKKNKEIKDAAVISYKEYEERYEWRIEIETHSVIANTLELASHRNSNLLSVDREAERAKAKAEAEKRAKELKQNKKSLETYVKETITNATGESGLYWLAGEEA